MKINGTLATILALLQILVIFELVRNSYNRLENRLIILEVNQGYIKEQLGIKPLSSIDNPSLSNDNT